MRLMTLDEYLNPMSKEKREAFAERLGVAWMYLYGVSKGHKKRKASISLALRIEAATRGKVPAWELRSELHPDRKKRLNGVKSPTTRAVAGPTKN